MTSGEKIKELRKKYRIKQKDLVTEGLSRSLISLIETDERKVTQRIASFLNQRFSFLVEGLILEDSYFIEKELDSKDIYKNLLEDFKNEDFNKLYRDLIQNIKNLELEDKFTICFDVGDYYIRKQNYLEAKKWYDFIFFELDKCSNLEKVSLIVDDMIVALGILSSEEVFKSYESYIEFYIENLELQELDSILLNLSVMNVNFSNYEKALYYNTMYEKKLGSLTIGLKISRGYLFNELHRHQEALELYKNLLKETTELEYITWINLNMIRDLIDLGEISKAKNKIKLLKEEIDKVDKLKTYLPGRYLSLGNYLMELGKTNEGKESFVKALSLYDKNELVKRPKEIYEIINNLFPLLNKKDVDLVGSIVDIYLDLKNMDNDEKVLFGIIKFYRKFKKETQLDEFLERCDG